MEPVSMAVRTGNWYQQNLTKLCIHITDTQHVLSCHVLDINIIFPFTLESMILSSACGHRDHQI